MRTRPRIAADAEKVPASARRHRGCHCVNAPSFIYPASGPQSRHRRSFLQPRQKLCCLSPPNEPRKLLRNLTCLSTVPRRRSQQLRVNRHVSGSVCRGDLYLQSATAVHLLHTETLLGNIFWVHVVEEALCERACVCMCVCN